jgi:hypothetical protein
MGHGYHCITGTIPGSSISCSTVVVVRKTGSSYSIFISNSRHFVPQQQNRARFGLVHARSFIPFHDEGFSRSLGLCLEENFRLVLCWLTSSTPGKRISTLLFVYGVRGPKEWRLHGHEGTSFVFPTQCHCPSSLDTSANLVSQASCLACPPYMKLAQSLSRHPSASAGYSDPLHTTHWVQIRLSGYSVLREGMIQGWYVLWGSCARPNALQDNAHIHSPPNLSVAEMALVLYRRWDL